MKQEQARALLLSICLLTLRKHAYSNILKILPPKKENFQIKIPVFFINT